jgi:hypothetical protein
MAQPAEFNFPDPNYDAQNKALHERWEQNAQAITTLQNVGMDHQAEELAIRGMAELSDRAYTMARTLGLHAIAEGRMSRVELSRLLGVHQQTVANWIKEAQTEPDRDYAASPLTRVHQGPHHHKISQRT